ncbi:hypothetical protein ACF0H5_012106 [Mactra antiquata]
MNCLSSSCKQCLVRRARRSQPVQMASQMVRYGTLVIGLFIICVVFYTIEYTSVPSGFNIASIVDRSKLEKVKDIAGRYFQVSTFNVTNNELELKGYFNGTEDTDYIDNKNQTMVVGGLRSFIEEVKPILWKSEKLDQFKLPHQHLFNRDANVKEINCQAIIKGDKKELEKAEKLDNESPKVTLSAEYYINMTSDCSNFIQERGYITDPLTEMEKGFPVAYSLIMYKELEQSERLLRAIYRPQNYYCVHVDSKTDESIYKAMCNIANCLDNVFILQDRFDVKWGTMTVLQPELSCMQELWNKSSTWKYFINLTGQEFPLRTNYELVQILQAYDGANDIEATVKNANKDRWEGLGTPPHGIVATKGSVHITASRGFVDYILHDQRAQDFLNWTAKTKIPDETFFASLNHNPILGVPGSYRGLAESDITGDVKPFVTRFKNWGMGQYNWPCRGQRVRLICVFGTGDLPLLSSRRELFANKFYIDYKRFTLDCMEELHFNHTRDEYLGKLKFDVRWYSQLGFVSNKIT